MHYLYSWWEVQINWLLWFWKWASWNFRKRIIWTELSDKKLHILLFYRWVDKQAVFISLNKREKDIPTVVFTKKKHMKNRGLMHFFYEFVASSQTNNLLRIALNLFEFVNFCNFSGFTSSATNVKKVCEKDAV